MKHVKKSKSQQYDHLRTNPIDPSMHPATSLPQPTGGAFSGDPSPFSPMQPPNNTMDYDPTAG